MIIAIAVYLAIGVVIVGAASGDREPNGDKIRFTIIDILLWFFWPVFLLLAFGMLIREWLEID